MSNELKPGTWTRPSNEKEWRAILDLAKSLGVGGHEDDRTYTVYRLVAKLIGGTQDVRAIHYESPGSSSWKHDDEVSCDAFIAGMYGEAERRKKMLAEGDRIYAKGKPEIWQDHEKQLTSLAARIEKLERENGKPLVSEDIINSQVDRINRFTNTMTGDDFYFCFDPKASPKGIPFSVALEYARNGRVIHRGESASTYSRHRIHGAEMNIGALDDEDMLANDWQVIPEP